ncbi:hypothetical protein OSB04_010963 [Centaurea solstitialis]|uniref:TIR domain-containing protein n=1 Tax=Centaurea solstitialis TaxID=347529 RepID=A0AA38T8J8_9ASTR|nr:hypothetical protein OSB04_010963 [Centaurea solstitialis]
MEAPGVPDLADEPDGQAVAIGCGIVDPSFITAMASSSTSSILNTSFKYDVFLSFRGEDTRTNFVDHLYHALKRQNIETYKDDKNLEKGKKISKELIEAIEESRFHVIIFSKNYASSSWCLDELVKIIECQEMQTGHTVYPIFYDVEPTDVRKQSGEFGEAFSKHENDDAVEKWRKALVEATSFGGRNLRTTADRHEVKFIQLVVKDISSKLPAVSADGNLIGMRTRISDMLSPLNAFLNEACMIGIWGMGGSGKTTLARAVFDQIRTEFEGSSFVENVRECSNSVSLGLKSLQQQVLRDVFKSEDIVVKGVLDGKTEMKKRMHGIKVLVVLDDIDHLDQLKALAGELNWFKSGSKIIITTRDKQVLVAHKVNLIHDASLLTNEEAVCLLSRCAFGKEIPIPGYEELSKAVVRYAAGLPLTITILGSSLCEAKEDEWIDTIKRLEIIPLKETLQKLELSYMGLEDDCKEIFLDVACIMKGWSRKEAVKALESCGFRAIHGLNVLEKRSLITISKDEDLYMHDHIEEMGRHIVTETTCLKLSALEVNQETIIKGLKKMKKLRFLLVKGSVISINRNLITSHASWMSKTQIPLTSIIQRLVPNIATLNLNGCCNLVELEMPRECPQLKYLSLSCPAIRSLNLGLGPTSNIETLKQEECDMFLECPQLETLILTIPTLRTLDIGSIRNLERLDLEGCYDLVELRMRNGCLKLESIEIRRCSELKTLDLRQTPNLKRFRLQECSSLVKLHVPVGGLKKLIGLEAQGILRFTKLNIQKGDGLFPELTLLQSLVDICPLHPYNNFPKFQFECSYKEDLHSSNGNIEKLISLGFSCACTDFESFSESICGLKHLGGLELKGTIPAVPKDLDCLRSLERLTLSSTSIKHLPNNILLLKQLKSLALYSCELLEKLPEDLGRLECLEELTLESTNIKHLPDSICMLKHLKSLELGDCMLLEKLPEDLGRLECLEELTLESKKIRHLPDSICMLKHLKTLTLMNCKLLEKLPEDLGQLECLEKLCFKSLKIKNLPDSICMLKHLESLTLDYCKLLEKLPEDLGRLECLEELTLESKKIRHLPDSICMLKHLKSLTLNNCELLEKLPEDLGRLGCLEQLYLKSLKIIHLPESVCMLKHLKSLTLNNCELLEKLPQGLGRLECLETLMLHGCVVLQDIPNSICRLKSLKCFSLRYCNRVEELPNKLGRLDCLKELDIRVFLIESLPPPQPTFNASNNSGSVEWNSRRYDGVITCDITALSCGISRRYHMEYHGDRTALSRVISRRFLRRYHGVSAAISISRRYRRDIPALSRVISRRYHRVITCDMTTLSRVISHGEGRGRTGNMHEEEGRIGKSGTKGGNKGKDWEHAPILHG